MVLNELVADVNRQLQVLRDESQRAGDPERVLGLFDQLIRLTDLQNVQPAALESPTAQPQLVGASGVPDVTPVPDCLHQRIINGECQDCGSQIASMASCPHTDANGFSVVNVFGQCSRCHAQVR